MNGTIKNILIFAGIGIIFILIFIFFIKKPPEEGNLVSTSSGTTANPEGVGDPVVTQDFLSLLLNVQTIKLDDAILSDNAFIRLKDSSITLIPDGTEGRPNPFAPIGIENSGNVIKTAPKDVPKKSNP